MVSNEDEGLEYSSWDEMNLEYWIRRKEMKKCDTE